VGAAPFVLQAGVLARQLAVDQGLVEFLRGFAAGQAGAASALPGGV